MLCSLLTSPSLPSSVALPNNKTLHGRVTKSMPLGLREASDQCVLVPQLFTQRFVFPVPLEHTSTVLAG